jgi:hypothetical protein
MAGGNGALARHGNGRTVSASFYVPYELKLMIEQYQDHRSLPTFSMACRELIETHPAIAEIVAGVYAAGNTSSR